MCSSDLEDRELENLRGCVSQVIAARLEAQLAEEQAVPWVAGLTFLPDGFEFRPTKRLTRPPPEWIPYDEFQRADFNGGKLLLYTAGVRDGKPRLTILTSTPNFYPGFVLLQSLCPRLRG